MDGLRCGVEGVAWPPLAEGAAALLEAYAARLAQSERLPAEAIQAGQLRQLGLLAAHCAAQSPAFAARLKTAGLKSEDLAEPGGLARLPPLTRQDLQRADGLYCHSVPSGHLPLGENRTSGSTGEPVRVRRSALNHLGWMAATVRDHRWHGRNAQARLAAMSAHTTGLAELAEWGPPLGLLYETGRALTLPATLDVAALHRALTDFGPGILVIYPSMLAALLDRIERGAPALPGLSHLRCMSETVHPELRERARAILGVNPEDAYTSEECGFIALQCPDAGGYHAMAETHLVEIVGEDGAPCRPGETGRVLVTDLHNFATPLIRYDIGDWAVAGGRCPCGRGLPRIERIMGRTRNLVAKPDGTRHWPLVGYAKYRDIAPVVQYQLIQHDLARIEMRLVVERALTTGEEAALAAQVRDALGHPFAIDLRYFSGRLPPGPSGKREEFISLLS